MNIAPNTKPSRFDMLQVSLLYYIIFAFMGIFLRIHLGLYVYDLIVIAVIFIVLLKKPAIDQKVGEYLFVIWTILLFPAVISIAYQIFIDMQLTAMTFYIVHNLFILSCYITFVSLTIKYVNLNYNIIVLLIAIPIFSSIAMYFSPPICRLLDSIYAVDHYPGRFGGIFGRDVNQLGYHSTLLIIFASYLKVKKRINLVFYPVVLLSLFTIGISGMRTGILLIVFFFPLLSIFSNFKIIKFRDIILFTLITASMSFFFNETILEQFQFFKERFSLHLIYNQITNTHQQHIGGMYEKVFTQMYHNDEPLSVLLSFKPEWKFPDSFIIFVFANGGLLGFFSFITFALFNAALITGSRLNDKAFLFFILLFNILICIKGNFMFNNVGMFIFVLTVITTLHESSVQLAQPEFVSPAVCLPEFSKTV